MSEAVITVEKLGKRYSLSHLRDQRYIALRDVLVEKATGLFRRSPKQGRSNNGSPLPASREDFWALKDVSFEVKQGEVVGIIGRNGAGKSTLLKILSRITEPTEGTIHLKGRVASLLEVGTGFHPELTGRENIFLNGAILGMTRVEIRKKFDEIVAFAETEKFLDTPVKRYSSGMYVRLAFAVAAHLEPGILIVDEVLAVGDADFQDKCLGKMREVSGVQGRTVLFVSHNMGAIQTLCNRSVLIDKGVIKFTGDSFGVVRQYLKRSLPEKHSLENCKRTGTGEARVRSVRFEDDNRHAQTHFRMGEPLNIVVQVELAIKMRNPLFGINILTDTGTIVCDCRSSQAALEIGELQGMVEYRMRVAELRLFPRTYIVEPWITDSACLSEFDWVRDASSFVVTSGPRLLYGQNAGSQHGIWLLQTEWEIRGLR